MTTATKPNMWQYLTYCYGRRLPNSMNRWVAEDLAGHGAIRRHMIRYSIPPALVLAPLGLDTVDDVRLEARATWDLGQLVFNPQELQAHTQVLRAADARREIATTVNQLFFQRRKLLAGTDPPDPADLARAAELDAELDALTGGAFASCR